MQELCQIAQAHWYVGQLRAKSSKKGKVDTGSVHQRGAQVHGLSSFITNDSVCELPKFLEEYLQRRDSRDGLVCRAQKNSSAFELLFKSHLTNQWQSCPCRVKWRMANFAAFLAI